MMQTLIGADKMLVTLRGRVSISACVRLDDKRTTVIRSEAGDIELEGWRDLDVETLPACEYIGVQDKHGVVSVERVPLYRPTYPDGRTDSEDPWDEPYKLVRDESGLVFREEI